MKKRKRNKTGILVAIIYSIIMYFILSNYDQRINYANGSTHYVLLPLGVLIIIVLFDYFIKKDIFDRENHK
ncbi:hypothetical protein [Mammaliicoccus sp. I-M35]|uniref:hypothetical protein n=1 Tax=Mammaliicoccus TaxID=2803850 RepID=UPI001EFA6DB1|nr:hypothetical protein [Mammaliicoccus sp. I-M35]